MLSLPFAFQDSQNLCFMLKLGCTPSDAIHLHVTLLPDLPDHGRYPPPTLSPVYSISLASCLCLTLLPVSPIHVTLHSCVSHSHFQYPRPNALLPILVYKTLAYVCIQHVQILTLILVLIVYSTHSVILNSDSVLPE